MKMIGQYLMMTTNVMCAQGDRMVRYVGIIIIVFKKTTGIIIMNMYDDKYYIYINVKKDQNVFKFIKLVVN